MTPTAAPPGPKLSALQGLVYRPGVGNPLTFFSDLAKNYGDVVSYRMGGEQVFVVSDPQLDQGHPGHAQPELHQRPRSPAREEAARRRGC